MNWHARYLQQAAWTRGLRDYLFDKTKLSVAGRVLEVGSGTGAILSSLHTSAALYGLDLDADSLRQSHHHIPTACLTRGDAHFLPYPTHSFDITYCHFLLLWVRDPLQVLLEMKRVTRSHGYVLALAEPDYTARTDGPEELIPLGRLQNESLERQDADIGLGVHLADLFFRAGIALIETGPLQGQVAAAGSTAEWQAEWDVLESDLSGLLSEQEIARWKKLDEDARMHGTRLLNVPTYFAWGQV
jgi:SAM-dependent methyltransferase